MKKQIALFIISVCFGTAFAADGKEVYDKVCYKCHRSGVDDAPKPSDKAAWAPRLATGMEALYKSVIEGKGEMPPRADKPHLSDEELKAAVDYIVSQVK
ncbi:MAG: c-type cytochrome [Burkholderiales bacterium]|nr:c-type cytochrome [Burkholderiales bacterium]